METARRHNSWIIAATATLSATLHIPGRGRRRGWPSFKSSPFISNAAVQDHDAEIRFGGNRRGGWSWLR